MQNNFDYFIESDQAPLWKRSSYFLLSLAVLYFAFKIVDPLFGHFLRPFLSSSNNGLGLFLGHVFYFSIGGAIVTCLFILALVKLNVIKQISLTRNLKKTLIIGFIGSVSYCALMILFWVLTDRHFQFVINWYSITGNLFSNFYEEVCYRALLVPISLYLFRNKWAAFLVSAFVMALTHAQYPLFLRIWVGVGSFIMAAVYYETGNLLAPWVTHQGIDMVLDTILVL